MIVSIISIAPTPSVPASANRVVGLLDLARARLAAGRGLAAHCRSSASKRSRYPPNSSASRPTCSNIDVELDARVLLGDLRALELLLRDIMFSQTRAVSGSEGSNPNASGWHHQCRGEPLLLLAGLDVRRAAEHFSTIFHDALSASG